MPKLKKVGSEDFFVTDKFPKHDGTFWNCGNYKIYDPDRTEFETEIDEPVPPTIEIRQAKMILNSLGLLKTIENLIKQENELVQILWNDAATFERTNPVLNAMAIKLGLTSDELDSMFIEANKL